MASDQSTSTSARAADGPTDVGAGGWFAALKRAAKEVPADKLPHWAAALTYYAVLSIFPALLVLVAILGVIGASAIQPLIDNVTQAAPGPAREIVTSALQGLQQSSGGGALLSVGVLGALWTASAYVGAFMDASNAVWDVEEGRPLTKKLPVRIGITVLMLVLLSVTALAVVLTGPLAQAVGDVVGVGDTALTVWGIAKWPVLVLLVGFVLAVLYWAAPNVRQPGFRWVTPGGLLAIAVWIVVSAAFAFYVANFGSYNATYGALGGVIVFLIWLWLTNLAILFGAEVNAELERGRQVDAGHVAPDEEPFLPLRDEPKEE